MRFFLSCAKFLSALGHTDRGHARVGLNSQNRTAQDRAAGKHVCVCVCVCVCHTEGAAENASLVPFRKV